MSAAERVSNFKFLCVHNQYTLDLKSQRSLYTLKYRKRSGLRVLKSFYNNIASRIWYHAFHQEVLHAGLHSYCQKEKKKKAADKSRNAQWITGNELLFLQDIYIKLCMESAWRIIKDPSPLNHCLFKLLPSGR